ncbi:MAG: translocation/assembly module TamB [Robiginitalea sp.]
MKTYEDAPDTNLGIFISKLDSGKPREPGTPPFYFYADNLELENSRFSLWDGNLEKPQILDFTRLDVEAEDFTILGPKVSTRIASLDLKTSRGVSIEQLSTSFTYTREYMNFDSLLVKTPESELKGSLRFDYKREDLAEFTDKVQVTAQFSESTISLNEINQLYDVFGKDRTALLNTTATGTLNDLQLDNLLIVSDNSGIRGNFNFENLFDREEPFSMDANVRDITTSYYQLRGLMPELLGNSLPEFLKSLGQFTIRGPAEITETSVMAQVNIESRLGNSYVDLNLTQIDDIENAKYSGFVSLIDFDLGRFVGDPTLGKSTLDVNVEGQGFTRNRLNTEIIGQVYSFTFNDYTYSEIAVSGILKDELFDGSLRSNDPNFEFDFKGLADFGSVDNTFNFVASVAYADLYKLNFIEDSVAVFKGNVNMDMVGNDLDKISGDIRFTETSFQNVNNTYYFEDFEIRSRFDADSVRSIEINSPDIITGYMRGRFRVGELGKVLKNSIGTIYTNYQPDSITPGQELSFNFKIYNKIVEVFFPEVSFGPNTFIRGDIMADDGDFNLNFRSPGITAFGNQLDTIDVRIDNKNPLYNTYVSVQDISTVYYDLQDFELINTTLSDTLFFRTEFKGGSELNDRYNLNFYHTFDQNNKSVIGLKRSDVSFKGNTWVLNAEGNDRNKVIISPGLDSVNIEEIVMNNEEREEILLKGQFADSTYKDLELRFKIVSLNKITPDLKGLDLKGEVNGVLNVLQQDEVYLPIGNLEISEFAINDFVQGKLDIGIVGNRNLTEFSVNSTITEDGQEKFSLIGTLETNEKYPTADMTANLNQFPLEPFNPLAEGILSEMRGTANGSARITGDLRNLDINGQLALNDAGLGIPYLNVNYDLSPNATVRLFGQTFEFKDIGLSDTQFGTRAALDGTISHSEFADWRLDLDVSTQDSRFLILNTEFDEDELYYGTAFVNGTGRIFGPTTGLNIKFDGSSAAGTSLKIPISDVASVGDYSFITFTEKDNIETLDVQRTLREYQGLELEFDLIVTPDAEVEIVVDQRTGSSLKGTGEGIVFMEINTKGKFNMWGDFVVVTGQYRLRYGGIIDKTFLVRPGGTINWDGDPLEAILNMEALYELNANPAPLLDNTGYTRRIPTEVVVRLTDQLEKPTVGFDIQFPGTSSVVKSELEYRLQDPTVEERNALFLLAQGTFVNDRSGLNQQAVTGNVYQTASNLFSKALSGDQDVINWGVSYESGYQDPRADVVTEDRIGVTVSTKISDRVLFNGRFGVPVGGVDESSVAGDAEIQVMLNDEGTLRGRIFNRQNELQQFATDRQGYTQGVGLSYEVDFNNFQDLVKKIFQKQEQEETAKDSTLVPQTMGQDSLIRFYSKTQQPN